MTVIELYNALEKRFPRSLCCSWDNDGLMVCDEPDREVSRVLISLDVTKKVADYAEKNGCNVILSHHPLIFHKLRSLCGENEYSSLPAELYKKGISVISFHTRYDAARGGMNDVLAKTLGLSVISCFGEDGEDIARLCKTDSETDIDSFTSFVKERLNAPCVVLSRASQRVKCVAVLGGSGGDFIGLAQKAGADTFVTGSASYNDLVDATKIGINVIAVGHYYSENIFCSEMSEILAELDLRREISPIGCEIEYI